MTYCAKTQIISSRRSVSRTGKSDSKRQGSHVRKKGRRKIVCEGRLFVWYLKPDDDSCYDILHIISEDKKLILSYPLGTNIVKIRGNIKCEEAFCILPEKIPDCITPGFAARIISWAADGSNAEHFERKEQVQAKYGIDFYSTCLPYFSLESYTHLQKDLANHR